VRLAIRTDAPLTSEQLEVLRKAVRGAVPKDQQPRLPDDPVLRGIVEAAQPHVDQALQAIIDNVARVLDRSLD
jgi:hypothetical protein